MRLLSILFTLLIMIVGIAFTTLNANAVQINYLVGSKAMPLSALLLISLATGIILSMMVMSLSLIKLKAKNKWLESKLKRKEEELEKIHK